MARWPCSPESVRSSKTVATSPMSLTTVTVSPSLTAMPADSCPRCCRAKRPSNVRLATLIPGPYTPKTPHASFTVRPFSHSPAPSQVAQLPGQAAVVGLTQGGYSDVDQPAHHEPL